MSVTATSAAVDYEVTIGLEVHVQINTRSKMFCPCPVEYGAPPNSRTCPTCLGLPGALPVLNRVAIEKTILTGLMLDCTIPDVSKWDRKNYFYPDMPKNYQISQFDLPLCDGGGVPLYELCYPKDAQKSIANPGKVVRLTRIHLEEDVGKSTHHAAYTGIDFNRAGTPLMEIVSEPDIASAEEAVAYLNSLRQILAYGGVSDADMEKGQMRCDVNISVRPRGQQEYGAKIELKNLNSIGGVRRSFHHEIARQTSELMQGIAQVQSTRRWDDDLGETQLMRTKEDAHDYRYFPDPDLPPVHSGVLRERIAPKVPELPHQKVARFVEQFGISDYDAGVLSADLAVADYYDAAVNGAKSPKRVANWVLNDLLGALNAQGLNIDQSPVSAQHLRELTDLVEGGAISNNQAKEVFAAMLESDDGPAAIVKAKGFEQVSDTGALEAMVDAAIAANPDKVAEIQGGNEKLVNWLTGQVMKASGGKANPKVVTDLLRGRLGL